MERISRANDKPCYQPKLHAELVHQLWRVKEETGTPMTVLITNAVRAYLWEMQMVYEETLAERGFAPTVFVRGPGEEEYRPVLPINYDLS
jgi:hypothetical protein